ARREQRREMTVNVDFSRIDKLLRERLPGTTMARVRRTERSDFAAATVALARNLGGETFLPLKTLANSRPSRRNFCEITARKKTKRIRPDKFGPAVILCYTKRKAPGISRGPRATNDAPESHILDANASPDRAGRSARVRWKIEKAGRVAPT